MTGNFIYDAEIDTRNSVVSKTALATSQALINKMNGEIDFTNLRNNDMDLDGCLKDIEKNHPFNSITAQKLLAELKNSQINIAYNLHPSALNNLNTVGSTLNTNKELTNQEDTYKPKKTQEVFSLLKQQKNNETTKFEASKYLKGSFRRNNSVESVQKPENKRYEYKNSGNICVENNFITQEPDETCKNTKEEYQYFIDKFSKVLDNNTCKNSVLEKECLAPQRLSSDLIKYYKDVRTKCRNKSADKGKSPNHVNKSSKLFNHIFAKRRNFTKRLEGICNHNNSKWDINKKSTNCITNERESHNRSVLNLKDNQKTNIEMSKIEDFEFFGKTLGQGGYAIVRTAIFKPTNVKYAIKTFNRLKITGANKLNAIIQEIEI